MKHTLVCAAVCKLRNGRNLCSFPILARKFGDTNVDFGNETGVAASGIF